jgi:hypothetical protein
MKKFLHNFPSYLVTNTSQASADNPSVCVCALFSITDKTHIHIPIPAALWNIHILLTTVKNYSSKVWVCGRWLAGIVGSNPTGGMDVCLL